MDTIPLFSLQHMTSPVSLPLKGFVTVGIVPSRPGMVVNHRNVLCCPDFPLLAQRKLIYSTYYILRLAHRLGWSKLAIPIKAVTH